MKITEQCHQLYLFFGYGILTNNMRDSTKCGGVELTNELTFNLSVWQTFTVETNKGLSSTGMTPMTHQRSIVAQIQLGETMSLFRVNYRSVDKVLLTGTWVIY